MTKEVEEILKKINEYDTIIIHRHVLADGDAYGSQLGLKRAIKNMYPDKEVYAVGTNYDYLEKQLGKMDEINDEKYQNALVIVTDCGNVERIDDQRYKKGKYLIKIDHHPNVTPYGDLVWVDTTYTSASEMIGELVKEANWNLTPEIGRTIFFGIVTDSLRFMTNKVTPRTFDVAGFLLSSGFALDDLYNGMYEKDLSRLQANSELINKYTKVENGVGWVTIDDAFLQKYNIKYSENGVFANLLKDIKGIDIWVTFVSNGDGTWRVEFRSKKTPINEVAIKWGGGGHLLASGAMIDDLEKSKDIVKDLQDLLK